MDYQEAGVDVVAGRAFVQRIRNLVSATTRPGVLGGIGGFGGLFQLPTGYREPVLVSGTDGVGTKLKLAHMLNQHKTVGIDLVAMCANDILTCGAEPLFFLDYVATGKLEPDQLTDVVEGIATGCQQAGCALLGGETAEMPGFYQPGEYDLAGFCVGIVEKSAILDGAQVQIGDVAIALPSSGVHSNGYSLVRKIVAESPLGTQSGGGFAWDDRPDELGGSSLSDVFLMPTQIYVKPILQALRSGMPIHAMAHITGGGLPENLPRCLGEQQSIQLDLSDWQIPPVFQWLAKAGSVKLSEMFNTFNMGIGFVLIVPASQATDTITWLMEQNIKAQVIGTVVAGQGEVIGLPND